MKRRAYKRCLNEPGGIISQHDATIVSEFRESLHLIARLKEEGHTRACAEFQVLGADGTSTGHCICSKAEADDGEREKGRNPDHN